MTFFWSSVSLRIANVDSNRCRPRFAPVRLAAEVCVAALA